jgi:hypothetical protein
MEAVRNRTGTCGRVAPAAAGVAIVLVLAGAAATGCADRSQSTGGQATAPPYRAQVSGVSSRCTLPITTAGGAALVDFPGGTVRVAGTVRMPAAAARNVIAFERADPAYDARFSKWFPGVTPQSISTDGATYAQTTALSGSSGEPGTAALDVVDVASGRRTRLWSGPGFATVLGFGPDGIYFSRRGPAQDVSDVWVVAADRSRAPRRVGPTSGRDPSQVLPGFQFLGGGAAWAVAPPPFTPTSTNPLSGVASLVLRMDLRTGAVTTYFHAPEGKELGLVGVDALGEPIVLAFDAAPPPNAGPPQVLLIGRDGTQVAISRAESRFVPNSMFADGHGIWFGGPSSVWLYTPAAGVHEVAKLPASAPLGPAVFIAGPCR